MARQRSRMLSFTLAAIVASSVISSPIQARAFVRIERPAIVSADWWRHAPAGAHRRERIVKDEDGERRLLRLFEYE